MCRDKLSHRITRTEKIGRGKHTGAAGGALHGHDVAAANVERDADGGVAPDVQRPRPRRLDQIELRSAYLRAVPLLRPFVAQETPPALACAARVYAVGIDDFAMWDPDAAATTFVAA